MRKQPAVLGLDVLAFEGLKVVKSCRIEYEVLILRMEETLTLERTWEAENAPGGKLSKFN